LPLSGGPRGAHIGVEAGGLGKKKCGVDLCGHVGVLHGSKSYVLQNETGQIRETHSLAPGLDYPGVGPELSYLNDQRRVEYVTVSDYQAVEGMKLLAETEGIFPPSRVRMRLLCNNTVPRLRPTRWSSSIFLTWDKDLQGVARFLASCSEV